MTAAASKFTVLDQKAAIAAYGTSETCWHVRSLFAIRGKEDIGKAVLNKGVSQGVALATFLSAG